MNKDSPVSTSIKILQEAQTYAFSIRPKLGGFPVLAEVFRRAGVKRNIWTLPSCQSIYIMDSGNIVIQGTPIVSGISDIPRFNKEALIRALRTDQNGKSTFQEFLISAWKAGVIKYDVDFEKREVIYYGSAGESYTETYIMADV